MGCNTGVQSRPSGAAAARLHGIHGQPGTIITSKLVDGLTLNPACMQGIYRLYHPECTADDGTLLQPCGISLQAWIAIFGAVQLIISQLPDISSLRELNLFCTLCTVLFAIGCLGMSIYNGKYSQATQHAFEA